MARFELKKAPERTPLSKLTEDYLADLQARGRSPRTIDQYAANLRRVLLPLAAQFGATEPGQLNQQVLNRITTHLLQEGGTKGELARSTVHSYIRTLNQFLNWARSEQLGVGPGRGHLPRLEQRIIEVLSREEIRAMEGTAATERDKLMIRLLADTGMRLGELLALRVEDMIEQGRERYLRARGKGSRERLVPLSPALYARLRRYVERGRRDDSRRIFIGLRRRPDGFFAPVEARTVEDMIRSVAADAGISRRVHPHLMRHSYATWALRKGMNPLQLQRILGHADLTMITSVYAHLTASDAHAAMMQLLRADDD